MGDRYRSILLFGAPGVGKGTQGKILGTIPGFYHMSTGEMFRQLNHTSELGRVFHEYSMRGELVPDEVTINLWHKYMEQQIAAEVFEPRRDVLVLDGVPRNLTQAFLLDEHIEVLEIIHLVCSDWDAMVDRLRKRMLKEQRADDAKESVIRRRFEVYEAQTAPVLEHYPAELTREIDALGTPAQVLRAIMDSMVPLIERVSQAR